MVLRFISFSFFLNHSYTKLDLQPFLFMHFYRYFIKVYCVLTSKSRSMIKTIHKHISETSNINFWIFLFIQYSLYDIYWSFLTACSSCRLLLLFVVYKLLIKIRETLIPVFVLRRKLMHDENLFINVL